MAPAVATAQAAAATAVVAVAARAARAAAAVRVATRRRERMYMYRRAAARACCSFLIQPARRACTRAHAPHRWRRRAPGCAFGPLRYLTPRCAPIGLTAAAPTDASCAPARGRMTRDTLVPFTLTRAHSCAGVLSLSRRSRSAPRVESRCEQHGKRRAAPRRCRSARRRRAPPHVPSAQHLRCSHPHALRKHAPITTTALVALSAPAAGVGVGGVGFRVSSPSRAVAAR